MVVLTNGWQNDCMKITVAIDINKDALNWWHACNKSSYGIDWKTRISQRLQQQIVGKTKKEAFSFLLPHIKKLYKKNHINKIKLKVQRAFDSHANSIQKRMEEVTGQPLYRQSFTVFLTTFPRGPYNVEQGYNLSWIEKSNGQHIDSFLHELLHYQTIWYFRKENLNRINKNDFEQVKEALTVILNNTFKDMRSRPDFGYPIHVRLRTDILSFWKKTRNFQRTVKYGVSVFQKFRRAIGEK